MKFRGYIGIPLSVHLNVQIRVRPITFFGLKFAYHIWHTGVCVVYIHDPDRTLNFDLKTKFIGFLTCFCVWPITIFDLTLANHIWHKCLSPWEDVTSTFMILIRHSPLTSMSNFRVYDMVLCSGLSFFVLRHSHTLFGTWVYHHGTMRHVNTWPLKGLDLWPLWNFIFTMDLSLARCLCSLT